MSGFLRARVPEFAPFIDAAEKTGRCAVHPKKGHYHFVEFNGEIELLRRDARMTEAVGLVV